MITYFQWLIYKGNSNLPPLDEESLNWCELISELPQPIPSGFVLNQIYFIVSFREILFREHRDTLKIRNHRLDFFVLNLSRSRVSTYLGSVTCALRPKCDRSRNVIFVIHHDAETLCMINPAPISESVGCTIFLVSSENNQTLIGDFWVSHKNRRWISFRDFVIRNQYVADLSNIRNLLFKEKSVNLQNCVSSFETDIALRRCQCFCFCKYLKLGSPAFGGEKTLLESYQTIQILNKTL